MKSYLLRLVTALIIITVLITGVYLILEDDGQFSPNKCEEKGGTWDVAVELCHHDD